MKVRLGEDLKTGRKFELDLQELVTGRTFLASVSRYGKSYTCRRIVEQVYGKALIIIIDVESEYSTLRPKFPFLIIGRDVAVVPEAAEYLADQVVENDVSTIVDLGDPQLEIATAQEFVARFVERLIAIQTLTKKPLLVIAEEFDELCPERGTFRSASLQAMIKLAKKGGKRGMGLIMVTQRPSFISKYALSQATNKIIGRIEWPADLDVVQRYLRVSDKIANRLAEVDKGEFYVAGDFAEKEGFVKVGPVTTEHLGATPSVIPPAPAELKEVVAKLAEQLPKIQEKIAPAIPKVAEIEARIKEKFETAWQARLQRVEKERDAIKRKIEAKYETEIADLKGRLEEAQKAAALSEARIDDLLSHPTVKGALQEKLTSQQQDLVELLERKGPQGAEQIGPLYLKVKPQSVPSIVSQINKAIPGLVESRQGRYASRLATLFPVTKEAKAEAREIEELRSKVRNLTEKLERAQETVRTSATEMERIKKERDDLAQSLRGRKETASTTALAEFELPTAQPMQSIDDRLLEEKISKILPRLLLPSGETAVTLKRTLTEFEVSVKREIVDVDESSWEGKILVLGLDGFFDEGKGTGKIMAELVRRYNVSDSGGNRSTVNQRLADLVSKGILDRKSEANQWVYLASPEFKKRVKPHALV